MSRVPEPISWPAIRAVTTAVMLGPGFQPVVPLEPIGITLTIWAYISCWWIK